MCYKPSLLKNACTHRGLCAILRAQLDISSIYYYNNTIPKFSKLKNIVYYYSWYLLLLDHRWDGWFWWCWLSLAGQILGLGLSLFTYWKVNRLLPDVGLLWLGWWLNSICLILQLANVGVFLGHCRGPSKEEKILKHLFISIHVMFVRFPLAIHMANVRVNLRGHCQMAGLQRGH